ncbi:MAG: hypothetical protein R3F02_13875 [Thiolinea sp.]
MKTLSILAGATFAISSLLIPQIASAEDCISFNPGTTTVKKVNNSWKIVDGSHWMFDFGSNLKEAKQSYAVIRYYGLNKSCFVGRPGPSFTYMLRGNAAPAGSMPGEDCVGFNRTNLRVGQLNGRWKIMDGNHLLFDFGNSRKEAMQSLYYIQKYNMNKSCFVGRPGPSFKYLRR